MEPFLPYREVRSRPPYYYRVRAFMLVCAIILLTLGGYTGSALTSHWNKNRIPENAESIQSVEACYAGPKLVPPVDPQFSDLSFFRTEDYKNHSLAMWRGAVRIYTPSFDDFGEVGEDPRWDVFYQYEQYLKDTFPLVVKNSELAHVYTHGLVFIINGTDPSLKPVILMGHQDVVPVPPEVVPRWKYNPFEGYFDGKFLWGVGAADDKDSQIAIMEAIEKLLSQGWTPKRTVILSIGCDEEAGGKYSASRISQYLQDRYGPDSIFLLLDEGEMLQDHYGAHFAFPNVAEKGNMAVTIDLMTSGGHSSVPPDHTSIGIMSELIALIESDPYKPLMTDKNPFYQQLQCMASSGKTMPKDFRQNVLKMDDSAEARSHVIDSFESNLGLKYLATTSQAVTIMHGGMKLNALPEKVTIRIDHRVGYGTSLEDVKRRLLLKTQTIAKKYRLEVEGFEEVDTLADWPVKIPAGRFVLSTEKELPIAPRSPAYGPAWDLLAGTIRHVYEDFAVFPEATPEMSPKINVAPGFDLGNTDTRYFWPLTKNIFRFCPAREGHKMNLHTIDERVDIDSHIEAVAFYYTFLRNIEEADK